MDWAIAARLGAALLLTLLNGHIFANETPNAVDLRAAYCLRVKHMEFQYYDLSTIQRNFGPDSREAHAVEKIIEDTKASIRRLTRYLIPRIEFLDYLSIAAAAQQAEDDRLTVERETAVCYRSKCPNTYEKDISCWIECADLSETAGRMRSCADLSFLPY